MPWSLFGRHKMVQLMGACLVLASTSAELGGMCGTVIVGSQHNNRSLQSVVSCRVKVQIVDSMIEVFVQDRYWSLTPTQGWIDSKLSCVELGVWQHECVGQGRLYKFSYKCSIMLVTAMSSSAPAKKSSKVDSSLKRALSTSTAVSTIGELGQMLKRYITDFTHAFSIGIVMFYSASEIHGVQRVFEKWIGQCPMQFWPFSAPLVVKALWLPFMFFAIKGDAVHLRPLPRPFFCSSAASVPSSNKHVPQLPSMSFDPGPLFMLELHYISKGGSLQYPLLLFLDSRSLQRVMHIQSLICFLRSTGAKMIVTTGLQLFFQYYPSGLEYALARPSFALGTGLTYGMELNDTRYSSGNCNKQWQLIIIQPSDTAKEHFLQYGGYFLARRVRRRIFVLFGILLGGPCKLLGVPVYLVHLKVDRCGVGDNGSVIYLSKSTSSLEGVPAKGYYLLYIQESGKQDEKPELQVSDPVRGPRQESRQQKCGGAFAKYIAFLSRMRRGYDLLNQSSSKLWDPGDFHLLHRLGGKPNFKKGGMSGIIR